MCALTMSSQVSDTSWLGLRRPLSTTVGYSIGHAAGTPSSYLCQIRPSPPHRSQSSEALPEPLHIGQWFLLPWHAGHGMGVFPLPLQVGQVDEGGIGTARMRAMTPSEDNTSGLACHPFLYRHSGDESAGKLVITQLVTRLLPQMPPHGSDGFCQVAA